MSRAFFYGWVMTAVAFVVILIGAGTRAAPGALLVPIHADTGWTIGHGRRGGHRDPRAAPHGTARTGPGTHLTRKQPRSADVAGGTTSGLRGLQPWITREPTIR